MSIITVLQLALMSTAMLTMLDIMPACVSGNYGDNFTLMQFKKYC